MNRQEQYDKGMEMERAGATGAEIAAALGCASRQEWYDMKYRFKNNALTQRAAKQSKDKPEPAPILEGLSCVDKVLVIPNPAVTPAQQIKADIDQAKARKADRQQTQPVAEEIKQAFALAIKRELAADGEVLNYRYAGGIVGMRKRAGKERMLELTLDQARTMMAELGELLREVSENAK